MRAKKAYRSATNEWQASPRVLRRLERYVWHDIATHHGRVLGLHEYIHEYEMNELFGTETETDTTAYLNDRELRAYRDAIPEDILSVLSNVPVPVLDGWRSELVPEVLFGHLVLHHQAVFDRSAGTKAWLEIHQHEHLSRRATLRNRLIDAVKRVRWRLRVWRWNRRPPC